MPLHPGVWESIEAYPETSSVSAVLMIVLATPLLHLFSLDFGLQIWVVWALTFSPHFMSFYSPLREVMSFQDNSMGFAVIFGYFLLLLEFVLLNLIRVYTDSHSAHWCFLSRPVLSRFTLIASPDLSTDYLINLCSCDPQPWWSKTRMCFYSSCSCGRVSHVSLTLFSDGF